MRSTSDAITAAATITVCAITVRIFEVSFHCRFDLLSIKNFNDVKLPGLWPKNVIQLWERFI